MAYPEAISLLPLPQLWDVDDDDIWCTKPSWSKRLQGDPSPGEPCLLLFWLFHPLSGSAWGNWLSSWARWWSIPNQSQPNRGWRGDGSPCNVSPASCLSENSNRKHVNKMSHHHKHCDSGRCCSSSCSTPWDWTLSSPCWRPSSPASTTCSPRRGATRPGSRSAPASSASSSASRASRSLDRDDLIQHGKQYSVHSHDVITAFQGGPSGWSWTTYC